MFLTDEENIKEHWLDDVAVVVVPMELCSVSVDAVAFVPLHMFIYGFFNWFLLEVSGVLPQSGFDGGAEE